MAQNPHICASWGDTGHVQVILASLEYGEAHVSYHKGILILFGPIHPGMGFSLSSKCFS